MKAKRTSKNTFRRFLSIHNSVKSKPEYSGSLLLIRDHDFYQVMQDDADTVSTLIGIPVKTGTIADKPARWCGFPVHALNSVQAQIKTIGRKSVILEEIQ